jgi:hypothetical protein
VTTSLRARSAPRERFRLSALHVSPDAEEKEGARWFRRFRIARRRLTFSRYRRKAKREPVRLIEHCACPCRKTGSHFSGTCARSRKCSNES